MKKQKTNVVLTHSIRNVRGKRVTGYGDAAARAKHGQSKAQKIAGRFLAERREILDDMKL